jgi:hypothetical protein
MCATVFPFYFRYLKHSLMTLLSWVLLASTLPVGAMADYPSFGIITSVTGETQLVIDIKSAPDAKPDKDQRIINVAGVRGTGREANAVFQLEKLVLGRDVELQNCSRKPLTPNQLFCDVIINLGRITAPPVNLADMLRAWGLAQSGTATTTPATSSRSETAPSLKPIPPTPSPRGSRS